jgi:hypothetical protein
MLVLVPRLAPFLLLRCVRGEPLSYTTSVSDQGVDRIDFPDLEITFLIFLSIPLYVHGIIIHVTDYLFQKRVTWDYKCSTLEDMDMFFPFQ